MDFLFRRKKHSPKVTPEGQQEETWDYRAIAATDVGAVRTNNEDNLVFIRPFEGEKRKKRGCMALVADGMGGHKSGEIASQMATDIIPRTFFDLDHPIEASLKQAFDASNQAIFQRAAHNPELKGMGTTCTTVVLVGPELYLAHVGDSRAYLLKGEELIQLSQDHTYVQHLLNQGIIGPEEVLSHPDRNVITQAMGTRSKLKADIGKAKVLFGETDKLILCSDGMYEYISAEELKEVLQSHSLGEAAKVLIDQAKQRGGHDNISVLLVEAVKTVPVDLLKETQHIQS